MRKFLKKLRGGSKVSDFEDQLEAMLPQLYKLACALSNKTQDAEDLVHDACVKALKSYQNATLPNEGASKAWVRSILVNCSRDMYRRGQRSPIRLAVGTEPSTEDGANVVELLESPYPSPEEWSMYNGFERAFRIAMASLPPEVRIVTSLFIIDDKQYKEIATIVNCPIGTVMSRLSRGRRLLQTALSEHLTPAESGGSRSLG